MAGIDLYSLSMAESPQISGAPHFPMWIESAWKDEDGLIYAWYHYEEGVCGGKLALPNIGALLSYDGGETFEDLGIVVDSGDEPDCNAQNGFFAGGHGDFSVVLDRERQFFYFLFTNYGGDVSAQGVAMARMPFPARADPVGSVSKLYQGAWEQPGLGGQVTPILTARQAWQRADTDSFWGPAIHWNTALGRWVVLLNHACCKSGWPQEGIYLMFGSDLADPKTWTRPVRLLDSSQIGFSPGYYPQAFGTDPGETDSEAGFQPRLYIKGISKWRLVLENPMPSPAPPKECGFALDVDGCGSDPADGR